VAKKKSLKKQGWKRRNRGRPEKYCIENVLKKWEKDKKQTSGMGKFWRRSRKGRRKGRHEEK